MDNKDYQELVISKLYAKYDELMQLQAKWGGTGRNEKQYEDQAQGVMEAILVIRNTNPSVDGG